MKKTRLVALVNLLAITASALPPVYADTLEDKLKAREAALTERAVSLSGKEIDLEDKEQELNRRNAELEAMSKTIQARNVENTVREIELEDMMAKLNKDSELLAANNLALARDREQVDVMKAEIERRSAEADKLAREAADRITQAESRETLAAERERVLTAREDELAENLSKLNLERAEILMTRQQNDEEAAKKLAELDKQEKNLKAAQEIFAGEKARLASERESLESEKAEAEKTANEARSLMAAAKEKEAQADEIIARNEEQANRIAELEKALQGKNDQIAALLNKTGPLVAENPVASDIPANSSVTVTDNGLINWSDGSIRAKGLGIPPENKNAEQAKALARRAAIVDLQRNILETIQGVQIDSKTTVKDFMASDEISSAVSGTIRGVEVVKEEWDGKTYVVYGQVSPERLSGPMSDIAKNLKALKLPKEPKKNGASFTGLIIDVRHLSLSQQKAFHVVDEAGKVVYGIEYADKNIYSQIGLCAYFERIVYEDNESRVGDTPLVVRAEALTNGNADIVIPNEAAAQIRKNRVDFRKGCKVIVVKS
ncbi:MAG: hypothetical protein IJS28_05905 [Synergistaceae bacterium]|nr:hypothetical protein [Synergistaceae bacterium]